MKYQSILAATLLSTIAVTSFAAPQTKESQPTTQEEIVIVSTDEQPETQIPTSEATSSEATSSETTVPTTPAAP